MENIAEAKPRISVNVNGSKYSILIEFIPNSNTKECIFAPLKRTTNGHNEDIINKVPEIVALLYVKKIIANNVDINPKVSDILIIKGIVIIRLLKANPFDIKRSNAEALYISPENSYFT